MRATPGEVVYAVAQDLHQARGRLVAMVAHDLQRPIDTEAIFAPVGGVEDPVGRQGQKVSGLDPHPLRAARIAPR